MPTLDAAGGASPVEGVIASIDRGLARVLIGENQEEWYFPIEMLPDDSEPGTCLMFAAHEGRYQPLGKTEVAPAVKVRSIEERLQRKIAVRKTGEVRPGLRRSDLE
ncbi:MAG: hypothetical protein N2037_13560 [Acidimicrobiales bacterium]|nr:hypothetical protein [Acidimicrobiales bacterium]